MFTDATAQAVVSHSYGLQSAEWSSWYLMWRYASNNGLMNKDIQMGTDRAEKQQQVSRKQIDAANKVVNHALRSMGLHA